LTQAALNAVRPGKNKKTLYDGGGLAFVTYPKRGRRPASASVPSSRTR